MSNSLSPISPMACSQLILVHRPLTIFIGYLRRRSPLTSSRTAAPLAQNEPRLIGLSQAGSWPIQTSLATSAKTVQPTEQCVQMLLRVVTAAPAGGGAPAAALRTEPSESAPSVASPPVRPERRRNVRRSRPPSGGASSNKPPLRVRRSLRLINTVLASLWIAVDAVIAPHFGRIGPVPGFALLVFVFRCRVHSVGH